MNVSVGEIVQISSGVTGDRGVMSALLYIFFYFPETRENKFYTTIANTLKIVYD